MVLIVRQVRYADTVGCYVALVTNGYNLFAFRFEVVLELRPVRYNRCNPAPLVVHLNTNPVYRRVMS